MAVADLSAQLPWQALAGQANAFANLGNNPQQAAAALGSSYAGNYNAALNMNQGLYSGIQTGYQNLRGQLDQQYQDVFKGYQNLYGDVLGRIAGTNQSNIQDINSQYNAMQGGTLAGLVSRGLGNSTTMASLARGTEMDRARAVTASQNQFAQLQAGYASQLGQAGLQSQQQGANLGANLGQNQLNFMNSVQAPYPNMGTYAQLAQMYGAQGQAQQDRSMQMSMLQQAQGPGAGTFIRGGPTVSGGSAGFGPLTPSANFGYSGGGQTTGGLYLGGGAGYAPPSTYTPPASYGFSGGNYQAPSPELFSGGYEYQPGPGAYGGIGDYGGLGTEADYYG